MRLDLPHSLGICSIYAIYHRLLTSSLKGSFALVMDDTKAYFDCIGSDETQVKERLKEWIKIYGAK